MPPRHSSEKVTSVAFLAAIAVCLGAIILAVTSAVVVGCEPAPTPKYKVGAVMQLKLTGEKVLIIEHSNSGKYICKVAEPSTNPYYMHKRVYIYEAELEPVTETDP